MIGSLKNILMIKIMKFIKTYMYASGSHWIVFAYKKFEIGETPNQSTISFNKNAFDWNWYNTKLEVYVYDHYI